MARRPHLTLCLLAAARALTTPPASRLGTPERAALGGVGAAWVALGARTFDAAERWELSGKAHPHRGFVPFSEQYFRLLPVALHEIGHVSRS